MIDNETKEVVSELDSVRHTMNTAGWKVIEKTFFEYLNAFDSISNYTAENMEDLAKEITINKKVMATLKMFWSDVQGLAETSSDINKILKEEENGDFLLYK